MVGEYVNTTYIELDPLPGLDVGEPEGLDVPDVPGLDDIPDKELCKQALRRIIRDPNSQSAAVSQAARTLLELSGDIGKNARPPVDPNAGSSTLTRAEMERQLAELE